MAKGRPSLYESKVLPRLHEIKQWAMEGIIDKDIAKLLGVGYSTLKEYKNKYPDFSDAMKESREILVQDLEVSLYQIAKGYTEVSEVRVKERMNKRTGELEIVTRDTLTKTYAPNITALKFSLTNLSPHKWQDKRVVENGSDELSDLMSQMASFGKRK